MMALVSIVHDHWHAVERDLLSLGFRAEDIGSRLSLGELMSIVMAAPSGSAVRYSIEEGWSKTDHLLANLTEQDAGLVKFAQRYPRPGVQEAPAPPDDPNPMDRFGNYRLTPMTIDELQAKREEHLRKINAAPTDSDEPVGDFLVPEGGDDCG